MNTEELESPAQPEWMDEWVADIAECWENMGLTLRSEIQYERDGDEFWWNIRLQTLPVKIEGQPPEKTFVPEADIDLLAVYDCFDPRSVEWLHFKTLESLFSIDGRVQGVNVHLTLFCIPDEAAEAEETVG